MSQRIEVRRARVPSLIAVVAVLGCGALFQAPGVRVMDVRVAALGVSSGMAEVDMELTNSGSGTLEIQGVRYHLEVEGSGEDDGGWYTVGEGFHAEPVAIPPGDTARVTVEVPFEYDAVGVAVRGLLDSGEVAYRLDGDLWIQGALGQTQIPIRTRGSLTP